MIKAHITSASVESVTLEFDRLDDGEKTNFRYTGELKVTIVSSGELTEEDFKRNMLEKILNA